MNIAVLGTGSVGTALAGALTAAGHTVIVGSRTPSAQAGTSSHAQAARDADLIVTALPGQAVIPTLEDIGDEALAGVVVLDVSNAFTPQFTLAYPNDSVAGQVQERFPAARVVKSLNTMNVGVMVAPQATAPGSTVFMSGDDDAAKKAVAVLLGDLGWPAESIVDLGGVQSAAGPEHYAMLFLALMAGLGTPEFNIAVVR